MGSKTPAKPSSPNKTAYCNAASEKSLSHEEAKLFYHRHQLEQSQKDIETNRSSRVNPGPDDLRGTEKEIPVISKEFAEGDDSLKFRSDINFECGAHSASTHKGSLTLDDPYRKVLNPIPHGENPWDTPHLEGEDLSQDVISGTQVMVLLEHGRSPPYSFPKAGSEARSRQFECWDHGCNGRMFSSKSDLLLHESNMKATTCPFCSMVFHAEDAYKGHLRYGPCQGRPELGEPKLDTADLLLDPMASPPGIPSYNDALRKTSPQEIPSSGYIAMQKAYSQNVSPLGQTKAVDSKASADSISYEIPRKKRGRPSKADMELRKAEAVLREVVDTKD